MNEKEACSKINDLRSAKTIYDSLLTDPTSSFFNCTTTKTLLRKTNAEIYRLEELIYNNELDSHLTHNGLTDEDLCDMAEEFEYSADLDTIDRNYLDKLRKVNDL